MAPFAVHKNGKEEELPVRNCAGPDKIFNTHSYWLSMVTQILRGATCMSVTLSSAVVVSGIRGRKCSPRRQL